MGYLNIVLSTAKDWTEQMSANMGSPRPTWGKTFNYLDARNIR